MFVARSSHVICMLVACWMHVLRTFPHFLCMYFPPSHILCTFFACFNCCVILSMLSLSFRHLFSISSAFGASNNYIYVIIYIYIHYICLNMFQSVEPLRNMLEHTLEILLYCCRASVLSNCFSVFWEFTKFLWFDVVRCARCELISCPEVWPALHGVIGPTTLNLGCPWRISTWYFLKNPVGSIFTDNVDMWMVYIYIYICI